MPADQPTHSGPRPWLLLALGAAFVALVAYQLWPAATSPSGPSNRTRAAQASRSGPGDASSLDVRLGALEQPPPEPTATGRNPFRFQPKAPPPPPPQTTRPTPAPLPQVVEPPQPVGPPPIPLKFFGLFDGGRPGKIAALSDGRDVFYGREGEIIDGRYRIVKIGVESIVMEYTNGTGRRTIPLRGQ